MAGGGAWQGCGDGDLAARSGTHGRSRRACRGAVRGPGARGGRAEMSQDDRTPMAPGIEGSGARGGTRKAVILAAGRGTRMQRASAGARLDPEQAAMADRGLKALIPFRGAPFIAYVATALADAGIGEICLVVRPWPDPIRAWAESVETRRVRLTCAVQEEPLGSAHALLAAEEFAAGEPILVINGDNYY